MHQGQEPDFRVRVVGFYREPLSRQVAEGVLINNTKSANLNSYSKFFKDIINYKIFTSVNFI